MRPSWTVFAERGAAFVVALLAVSAVQIWRGAFNAEMVGDAASHYVSGIFIADLLRNGLLHPLEQLRDFAAHYPLVGIGHWPPFYYGVEAIWSFLVPFDQRMAVLAATTAALVAASLYAVLRPRLGVAAAIFGSTGFVLSPLVLSEVTTLMLDIPVAFGCLMAAAAFAQFLRTGRPLPAMLFALVASATLLVKGNAGCLALFPPIAVAASGKFERLRSPWLWLSVPVVVALAGPWYFFTYKMTEAGYRETFGVNYALRSLETNANAVLFAVGPGFLLTALVAGALVLRRGRDADPLWACFVALIVSVIIFQALVPAALVPRYVLPAIPAILALSMFVISDLANTAARNVALVLVLLLILPGWPRVPYRPHLGISEAAQTALRLMPPNNRALLVVSDADGEGATISELLRLRSSGPEVFGVRGVRLLGGGGYNNQDYLPLYKTSKGVASAIATYRIPLLLLRDPNRPGEWAHISQVSDLMDRYPDRYQLVWSGNGGKLYKITPNYGLPGEDKLLTQLSAPHALGGGAASIQ